MLLKPIFLISGVISYFWSRALMSISGAGLYFWSRALFLEQGSNVHPVISGAGL